MTVTAAPPPESFVAPTQLPGSAFPTLASLLLLLAVPSQATPSTPPPHRPLDASLLSERTVYSHEAMSVDADHFGRRSANKASFDLAVTPLISCRDFIWYLRKAFVYTWH